MKIERWNSFSATCYVNVMLAFLLGGVAAQAQLAVTVSAPKITGSKAVVKLELKNNFAEKIESARAACFLLDEQGKVVGQSAQWVIGGTKDRPSLPPDTMANFNFVIAVPRSVKTNLQAKVQFSRVVLEGGKVADVVKDVTLTPAPK